MSLFRFAPLALLAALAGCGGRVEPEDHIRFAHGPHLAAGMSCVRCHGAAGRDEASAAAAGTEQEAALGSDTDAGSVELDAGVAASDVHAASASRPLLPAESDCRGCHEDPVRDRCQRCHTRPESPRPYAARDDDIVFDHAAHEAPARGRCVRCHGSEAQTEASFRPGAPSMETCTGSCHREAMRALECALCHTDLHRYRIDEVSLLDHGPGFLRRHGTAATADQALCSQCHDPTFCEDCHLSSPGLPLEVLQPTQQYRDFVHRGDFLARHGTEAGLERGTCLRCHGTPFCDDCHHASGIGGGVALGSPHPPGWLDPLSPFGHSRAARRDLLSCVSCHEADAETTCVPCHRIGGIAGNPHPAAFGLGVDPLAHAVCRTCHVGR